MNKYLFILASIILFSSWIEALPDSKSEGAKYYNYYASTKCEKYPKEPLYNGGIVVNPRFDNSTQGWSPYTLGNNNTINGTAKLTTQSLDNGENYLVSTLYWPSQTIMQLRQNHKYSLSAWVQIRGANSSLVRATIALDNVSSCAGTVIAKNGCWSFLKGGFVPEWSPSHSILFFQTNKSGVVDIMLDSVSLQPFTDDQWRWQQNLKIATKRKRRVMVHVSDVEGNRVEGAQVKITQKSWDFPFGSAISKTILDNQAYQSWFSERFNAAVFENELKWNATEPKQGLLNYTLADRLLAFCNANGLRVRGHNIFWEDPSYNPTWVSQLSSQDLHMAVLSRIKSVVERYAGNFVSWDVSNEMLHFSFYEKRLGPTASDVFFETAQQIDNWTPMFMNDYNVVETCGDSMSTVDAYVERLRRLIHRGHIMEGVGLESHFDKPNVVLMRSVLDKLATLGLPIWLTEIDVSAKFDFDIQASYLEEILREGFSHPDLQGMVMWTAMNRRGECYRMCLTDMDMHNLPAGFVVDRLISEWTTRLSGVTDPNGDFKFNGFFGNYEIEVAFNSISYNLSGTKPVKINSSIARGDGVQHVYIQL